MILLILVTCLFASVLYNVLYLCKEKIRVDLFRIIVGGGVGQLVLGQGLEPGPPMLWPLPLKGFLV